MHKHYLQQTIELASTNVTSQNGGPYGAIIVKAGKVIAASGNRVTADLDPTAHAEVMAIRLACQTLKDFKLKDCILYTSCEPCPMCLGAIYWARLKQVYFACNRQDAANAGFDDSFIYDEIPLEPQKRQIKMLHIELPDAIKPFHCWNSKENKTLY
ncbi:MAG: nucleoside deaminase [Methylococcaceae bacterium]